MSDAPISLDDKAVERVTCVRCSRKIREDAYRVKDNDGLKHMHCWRKERLAEALKPMVFSYPKISWR